MKKFTPLILLLVAIMVISSSSVTVGAANELSRIDYSDPSSPVSVEMQALDFMKLLIGEDISSVEAEYLDSVFGEMFIYSDVIPQKNVEIEYFAGILDIYATVYEYKTADGKTVKWIPTVATLEGREVTLSYSSSSGKYEGQLKNIGETDGSTLVVDYTCDFKIDADTVNGFRNYTYKYALSLWNENEEYKRKLEAYNAYQQYLAELATYNESYAEWEKYVAEKAKYERKYAEYQDYLEAVKIYNEKYNAYLEYLEEKATFESKKKEYEDYLAAKAKYDADFKAYDKYLADFNKAMERLIVFESIYAISDEYEKQLYGTLLGGLVDEVMDSVESNYSLLQQAGSKIKMETIIATREATKALRPILEEYNSKATYAEKFNYYREHYSEIKKHFNTLSYNLSTMFQDNAIKTKLFEKGEDEGREGYYFRRYIQLVCQIYVVSTGLDDSVLRNDNWYIYGEQKTPPTIPATYVAYYWNGTWNGYLGDEPTKEILDEKIKPKDRPSDPSDLNELPLGVVQPEPPVVVEAPVQPNIVDEPVKPIKVEEPIPPQKVDEPGEKPAEVADPGEKPVAVMYTAQQLKLISAIESGTLKERANGSDVTIKRETSLKKMIALDDKCIVSFYDYDGKTLLETYILDIGEKISYNGKIPSKENTDKYIYEFEGWKNEEGTLAELGVTQGNYMSFYASFSSTLKKYTVTWKVNGETVTEEYEYGNIPAYKGELTKESTKQYDYVFGGWDKPISQVEKNVTYTAKFEGVLKRYTVEWRYGNNTYIEKYNYGEVPRFKQIMRDFSDDKYIYTFAQWDKVLTEVKDNAVYTAKFAKEAIVEDSQGNAIKVEDKDDAYIVSVNESSIFIDKLIRWASANESKVVLNFEGSGVQMLLNETSVGDMITSGCKYVYIYINEEKNTDNNIGEYSVRFVDLAGNDVSLSNGVTVKFKNNITLDARAYVIGEDGVESLIASSYDNGTLSLQLNKSSTIVFKNEYSVTVNKCENGVLSSDTVHANPGDTVTVTLTFSDDFLMKYIKVVGNVSGTEYTLDGEGPYTFVMPEESVTVSAELKKKEFTIKFVVDGVVISEKIYQIGDKVVLPEEPQKEGEGDKVYSFAGWTPAITTVTEDATYTAVFKETVVGVDNFEGETGTFYLRLNLLVVGFVVAVVSTIVIIVVVRKKKKAKKINEESNN